MLVTTPDMNASNARLRLFTRTSSAEPWSPVGAPQSTMVGKNGLAWGSTFVSYKHDGEPEKTEGDKRTPAGFFRLGPSFGFDPTPRDNYIAIKPGETVCVEDPASPLYNTITQRSKLGSQIRADNMSDTSLFRNGLFVDYPSDRTNKRGSCIFVHIWRSPTTPTAGCVGLAEENVIKLQDFAQPGAVLAVIAETTRDRFPNLPEMAPPHDP